MGGEAVTLFEFILAVPLVVFHVGGVAAWIAETLTAKEK